MRLFFLCCLLAATQLCFGQLRKGDHLLIPNNSPSISTSAVPTPVGSNLGGLYVTPEGDFQILSFTPSYGFVVSDQVVLGANFGYALLLENGNSMGIGGASLFGRYYFRNTERAQLYGGLRAGFIVNNSGNLKSETDIFIQPNAGIGLPLSPGIIFSPELNYTVIKGQNLLGLNFKLEFVLGSNNRPEEPARGRYGRGSFMLGTQLGGLTLAGQNTTLRLSPDAYFFTGQRFALGVNIGTQIESRNTGTNSRNHFGLAMRYFPVQGKHIDMFVHLGGNVESLSGGSGGRQLYSADIAVGGLLFIRETVALEGGLGVRHYPDFEFTEFGLNAGVRFFLWN